VACESQCTEACPIDYARREECGSYRASIVVGVRRKPRPEVDCALAEGQLNVTGEPRPKPVAQPMRHPAGKPRATKCPRMQPITWYVLPVLATSLRRPLEQQPGVLSEHGTASRIHS